MANSTLSEIEVEPEAILQAQPVETVTAEPLEQSPRASALWHNRDYMLLWSGQLASTIGSTASGVVFPLLMLELTNSPAAAGIAGALFMLPYALFSLPAGALIDRWDRKRVMIICDSLRALVFAAIPVALFFNVLTVWQLYVSAFLEGSLFVFFNLAEVSALPRVVPKDQLPNAAAQNQATFAVAGILGPTIGTLLYQSVARMAPFVFDAVSYLASVFTLSAIKTNFQRERVQKNNSSLWAEIGEGVRWLWGQPLLRFMAFLGSGLNLLLATFNLALILLARNLGAPDAAIGTLFSVGSLGGLAGAIAAARILKRFGLGATLIACMWALVVVYPLFTVAPNLLALAVVVGVGFSIVPVLSVATLSYRAALVPDELQGRVNSAFRLISWGSQPVGAFLGGVMIEQIGVDKTLLIFSGGWVILALLTTLNKHVRSAHQGVRGEA